MDIHVGLMLCAPRATRNFAGQRGAILAVTFLSLSWLAPVASAQVEPFRLIYQAFEECPNESRFTHDVLANVEHARMATGAEVARTFLVTVRRDGPSIHGLLQIIDVDGSVRRRDVTGETCEEVVSALVLMVTLAIDPSALTAPKSVAPLDEVSSKAPTAPAAKWRWGAGLDAQGLGSFLPDWAPGGGVFVDVAGANPFVSSFRVSVLAATAESSFVGNIGARVIWLTGRIEACPGRLYLSDVSATVCLDLDAGVIASEGVGLASLANDKRPWIVPAALARLSRPQHGGPWIDGSAGVGVPLARYTFYYQRAGGTVAAVFQLPAVGAEVGLDVGYRFK
jgi:hypothetical protein